MENVIHITKPNPYSKTNIFSKLSFGWMIRYCYNGLKKTIEIGDIYKCLDTDASGFQATKLDAKWKEEVIRGKAKSRTPSLMKAIVKAYGLPYMVIGFFIFLVTGIMRSFQPSVLSFFIKQFSANNEGTVQDKLIYGSALVAMSGIYVFTSHQFNFAMAHIGMKVRVACCSLIYRKLLKLSTKSLTETAAGKIVNIISNDVNRFDLVVVLLHYLWIMPFQVALLIYLIWLEVGVSSFIGTAAMMAFSLPLQIAMAKLASSLRLKVAQKTDKRIKLMGQLIEGIQVVKMYVWEDALAETVKKIRYSEVNSLMKVSYIRGSLSAMAVFTERLVTFITVLAFILLGNTVTAEVIFALASFYNLMQLTTAIFYPLALLLLSETIVSINRIQEFLLLEEKEELKISYNDTKDVSFSDVKVFWELDAPTLSDITLHVPSGSLCAIVGPVGSGKSTLLQLLLGEVTSFSGTVEIGGTVSYSSQEAWIFASTVRKNILFGQEYERMRYREVVEACALKTDFEQFPFKDKTVVGEKGISLSGGQRARINLARTVYRRADIYLLDDPLSAVDAHVGKHLFEKCIMKYLKNKTRILVTHQLQYLKKADTIVVLGNTGRIEACGTFEELSQSDVDFTKFLTSSEEEVEEEKHFERSVMTASIRSVQSEHWEEEQLLKNAELLVKSKKNVYWLYARSSSNVCGLLMLFLSLLIAQVVTSGTDYWTSYWTKLEEQRSFNATLTDTFADTYLSTETCLIIYGVFILGGIIFVTNRSMLFYIFAMSASKRLHSRMFSALLKTTMRFFDTNPMGRILNRFSKDMGIIDELLPRIMLDAVTIVLTFGGILVNVTVSNPWMLIAGVVLGIIFILILQWYISVARDTRLLEGITKSPVFSHLNSTFNGLVTIRSTKKETTLVNEFDQHQDTHSSAWFLTIACISTFGLWLDILSFLFIAVVTYSFIFLSEQGAVTGSAVGLAVQQSLILIGMLSFGMRQMAEMISNMTTVERVVEYTNLEKEEDSTTEKDFTPSFPWPSRGAIVFKNLYLSYSRDDPPVLKNLCFTVEAGEKVGIVGRTGAGKTSLISALFRLAKLDGAIFIDGINTQNVPLKYLRKRISIIPQEPVLFSETMRYNLDPFDEFDDKRLWNALDEVELKDAISSLNMPVQEGGSNFSVGQRQLICLARAILRNNKILVLDEATANVDPRTDSLIQKTIRQKFKDCTVLTIAHRLNTVMDSDKILVMDAGHLAEYDHPYKLLQNKEGILYKLVEQTGTSMEAQLHKVAEESYHTSSDQILEKSRM